MKRILLTTTSLILAAGVVSAETSISWSGAATAGIAREGSAAAVSAVTSKATTAEVTAWITANETATGVNAWASATAITAGELVTERARIKTAQATQVALASQTVAQQAAALTAYNVAVAALDYIGGTLGSAKAKAGDWQSYSEVSTTVTGSVTADNGVTITAAVSVDAGTGYDFADDDGFDAAKTNGVGLDNITIATAMGTFKLDENAITHLVDGDDDAAADIMYTNTFGSASVSVAIDANKDTDAAFVAGVAANVTAGAHVPATTSTAQDVAWSAKVSMPVAGGSAYVAMDEEGGNIFGASTTLSGVGLTFSSKLEALDSELKADRSNTVGVSYAMGATTLGASWNSVEDGDQWGISAAYAADGLSISASTDEGSDWSVSGSMALGGGASVVAGTNYSEDAYLGLSFAF